MRPPSYYTSLASSSSSSSSSYGHRNSSQQLRTSLSSPSSSSYVARTHLPFVAQSTLVAHCFTGVGSSTKPYGQSSYSNSRSYTTSFTSRPKSTKRNPYLSSPSSTPSYSSPRSAYLSSGSSTLHYRPPVSSYYKPIRLRERPLLTQISRQFGSTLTPATATSRLHSYSKTPALERREGASDDSRRHKDGHEETWSSDVARNISRNKYLIKFRERPESAGQPQVDTSPPVEPEREQRSEEPTKEEETMRVPQKDAATIGDDVDRVNIKELGRCHNDDHSPESIKENQSEISEKKAPKKRIVKLKVRTANAPDGQQEDVGQLRAKKATTKDSPTEADPPAKPKVKRLVKTSKSRLTEPATTAEVPAPEPDKVSGLAAAKVDERDIYEAKQAAAAGSPLNGSSGQSSPGSGLVNRRIRFREYNIGDFNFLSVLGHGGWGFVILAELKEHDASFAVKCIKKITIVEDDDFDSIMIERKVLTLGNVHPFICKLFCTFQTEGYLFFVMEFCAGGDLMFHVQREGKFSESRCQFYAAEIICAIRFLHNQHIIYRDLKLDNILLDSSGHIRLVDFGMCQCRTYREEMLPSNFCGTPEYISPEIIKGVPYNHSVDWWSFGVLLYEMAVGKMPFRGNDENELLWNVCYEQIHYPMFLTKELATLLQALLEREPSKRMGMSTCKLGDIHDQLWFRGVDWAAIEAMQVRPPFVPEVNSKRDVQNFDSDFTESAPELSPVDSSTLKRIDQSQFQKFPYTNPNISIFD